MKLKLKINRKINKTNLGFENKINKPLSQAPQEERSRR